MKYPEHEKLEAIKDKSQSIGEFIEWLNRKKGIYLGKWSHFGKPEEGFDAMFAARESIENLLAEYFEIDLVKLEKEKRQMLSHALTSR